MSTHEVLVAAKGYLLNHGWWNKGGPGPVDYRGFGPRCMIGALCEVGEKHMEARWAASAALRPFAEDCIPAWNDDETRTLDEVIAAFDAAILATAPKDTPETSSSVTHVFA